MEWGMYMSFVYITEENAKLQKKGGRYLLGRNLEVIMEIPEELLEGLVLIGRIQVSAEAMVSLLESGVPVTWLSHTGKYYGRLSSTSHVDVFRQQKQIQLQKSPFFLTLGKKCIEAKVHNQLTVMRRYNRRANSREVETAINNILAIRRHIGSAEDSEQLMGFEGIIAKNYFAALGKLMPEGFEFTKRSKRPPLDPFNSMLSFGYTLLMYEIYTAVEGMGLNPYFGYLHALKNHHPALASDLMEEWRAVIVDSMVLGLVHHKEIKAEHFFIKDDRPGIFLSREGRAIFLRAFEKRMRQENKYMDVDLSYRKSIVHQAGLFSQAMMAENADIYKPLRVR